ncbi:hypothetical protein PENTCL1PPCAC_23340, partial [Pristionchus entomophagus]
MNMCVAEVAEGISNHFLRIGKDENGASYPYCKPDCEFIVEKANLQSDPSYPKYWSGILLLIPKANLNDCFENNPKTNVICHFKHKCIDYRAQSDKMLILNPAKEEYAYKKYKREILNCEVAAIRSLQRKMELTYSKFTHRLMLISKWKLQPLPEIDQYGLR